MGIGGKGAYYIAKFLSLLGIEIIGYDLKKNANTEKLEKLGIVINYRNPNIGEQLPGDFYLYSNDLPQKIQTIIFEDNKDLARYEIGHFYNQITNDYESDQMDDLAKEAFVKSDIAPLYFIDQSKIKYIGVTGTDGKTSTCTMIDHILKKAGYKVALVTTVSCTIDEKEVNTGFLHTTTPSSQELYKIIKLAEEAKCSHIIVECTSHGLEQGRLAGLKFDEVGYTNITSEHLDYHLTWENYCHAKSLLISKHLNKGGMVILNKDDKSFDVLSKIASKYQSYSRIAEADLVCSNLNESESGLTFALQDKHKQYDAVLPILGEYNVSNFMCAILLCKQEGIGIEDSIKSIASFETVKGRMQILQKKPFEVIVDYAHTSNALFEVLNSVKKHKKLGKIIHVFGTAGHRDFYKRPLMGKISNELADITILTAEDPRLESLKDINDQIELGWKEGNNKNGVLIRFDDISKNVENRKMAIKKALQMAQKEDTVVITGKAHEKSLCFGQIEYAWSDIEETKKLLSNS